MREKGKRIIETAEIAVDRVATPGGVTGGILIWRDEAYDYKVKYQAIDYDDNPDLDRLLMLIAYDAVKSISWRTMKVEAKLLETDMEGITILISAAPGTYSVKSSTTSKVFGMNDMQASSLIQGLIYSLDIDRYQITE